MLWDVTKDQNSEYLEYQNKSEYSGVNSVDWNRDDSLLVWVTSLGELFVMDAARTEILHLEKLTASSGLSHVTFSELYESIFFVGHTSGDLSLGIFDPAGGLQKTQYDLHTNQITQLISSKLNENLLISLSLDQKVCLFDLNEGQSIQKLNVGYPILCGDLNEADYTLVVGGVNGMMEKFDLRKLGEPVMTYQGHSKRDIRSLHFNKR